MSNVLLDIHDLRARVGGRDILKGITLQLREGEVHAIMGPNGSGKSTLSYVLAGREGYEITGGSVTFKGKDLLALEPEERAALGLFLGFQYPVEIPGVPTINFLKTCVNAVRKARGESEYDAVKFLRLVREKAKTLSMDEDMLKRSVNAGFSGGEKKRAEILQMALLEPSLAVLDETDSGLDIDALKIVSDGVNSLRAPDRAMLVITHYQRLLKHIVPDHVHVMAAGRIMESGGRELAEKLEAKGYAGYTAAA
jgi:Fe-S cluster assembly ATP-binding protein